jgi:hypothetical protein
MTEQEASRTLVKSPPELWSECSDASSLARHLDGFGEIRITRLEPESTVAWEGEHASGTVRLEPSGWGTRVTLTLRRGAAEGDVQAALEPSAATEPEPVPEPPEPELAAPAEVEAAEVEFFAEPEPTTPPAPTPAPAHRRGLLWWVRNWFGFESDPEPRPARTPERPAGRPERPAGTPERPAGTPEPRATSPEPALTADPPEPAPAAQAPEPNPPDPEAQQVLNAALESLGQAHHRPYSRA